MKVFELMSFDNLGVGVWAVNEIELWEAIRANSPGLDTVMGRKMVSGLEIGEYCSGPAKKQEGTRTFESICEIQRIA